MLLSLLTDPVAMQPENLCFDFNKPYKEPVVGAVSLMTLKLEKYIPLDIPGVAKGRRTFFVRYYCCKLACYEARMGRELDVMVPD
jgi:hypothetical protein